jgi:uncharacterized protein
LEGDAYSKKDAFLSGGISVTRTPDSLSAFLVISANRAANYPVREEILNELRVHGIVFGIDTTALDEMIAASAIEKQVLIAKGVPPQPGIPGKIEILIDVSSIGKPKVLADGRVDYHNISYVLNVRKGELLARRIPPVPGQEGHSVLGTPLPPPSPGDVKLKQGSGTLISSTDPDTLIAEFDGGIWIERDGTIEVHKAKKIPGDIDYQTGDINFTGDLSVMGTVRAGFSVETQGSLYIGDSVEDCKIKSRGNIVIKGGAFGAGAGAIECKGAISIRHVENFRVASSGEITVVEDIVHGTVHGGGCVRARSILGGSVASAVGVVADTIGSVAEVKTVIDIGMKYERLQRRYELLRKTASLTTEIGESKERIFQAVRDALDEKGFLSSEAQKALAALKLKTLELNRACAVTQAELESLERISVDQENPFVKALTIFPNTLVKFGAGEQLIREKMERVRLSPMEKGAAVILQCDAAD